LKEANERAATAAVDEREFREAQRTSSELHRTTQRKDKLERDKKTDAQVRHALHCLFRPGLIVVV